MQNPATLLTAIEETLKAIPELEGINIEAFTDAALYRTDTEASDNFFHGVMILYVGGEFPRTGEITGVVHQFALVIKCDSNLTVGTQLGYFDLITAIYNGTPATETQIPFVDIELPGCDPIQNLTHTQELDADGNQYWAIRFTASEK